MFSAIDANFAPAWAARSASAASPGYWCERRRSWAMTSACRKAAAARAASHLRGCSPAEARSRFAKSNRSFSSWEGCEKLAALERVTPSCAWHVPMKKLKASRPPATAAFAKRQFFMELLAAHAHRAEAQDDVAARGGPAKAHHGAEAGKE